MKLRICDDCGELAMGYTCSSCEEIERESESMARALVNIGGTEINWCGEPKTFAITVLRRRTEEKFKEMLAERDSLTFAEMAAPATDPRSVEHVSAELMEWRRKAHNLGWAFMTLLAFYYLLWQFRGWFYELFQIWFGGK